MDAEVDFAGDAAQATADLTGSIPIAGLLHILHNATNDLGLAFSGWRWFLCGLKAVVSFLRGRATSEKLVETCYEHRGEVGRTFAQEIEQFDAHVHEGRWGTIAYAMKRMVDVRVALIWGWDVFRIDPAFDPNRPDGDNPHGVKLSLVNNTVNDELWWAYLDMANRITRCLHVLLLWAESCDCHWGLQSRDGDDDMPPALQHVCKQCPFRSCRGTSLATGAFFAELGRIFDHSHASLLSDLPVAIPEQDKLWVLEDFERARTHLTFTLVSKLSNWTSMPWRMFGIAAVDPAEAKDAYHDIVQYLATSARPHPAVLRLGREPLRSQLHAWFLEGGLEGWHPVNPDQRFADLHSLFAELRLVPTSERHLESPHAKTQKSSKHAPCHTEAYMSLLHRWPEIEQALATRPEMVKDLAADLQCAQNPRNALHVLGMGSHPLVQQLKHTRDKLCTRIVYNSDSWCLYTHEPPHVDTDSDLDDGGGPGGPGGPVGGVRAQAGGKPGREHLQNQGHDSDLDGPSGPKGPREGASAMASLLSEGPQHNGCPDEALRRALAMVVVHGKLLQGTGGPKDPESDKSPSYFSMPFQQRALDCLDRLLTRSSTSHFPPEPVLSEGSLGFDGKGRLRLFFQVLSGSAHRHARSQYGDVQKPTSGDLAISVHPILHADNSARTISVSTSALRLEAKGCSNSVIMLTLGSADLGTLTRMCSWTSKMEIAHTLSAHYIAQLPAHLQPQVLPLVSRIVTTHGCISKADMEEYSELLHRLFDDAVLGSNHVPLSFTPEAENNMREVGAVLCEPELLLAVPACPLEDMPTYHVYNKLLADGWEAVPLSNARKEARVPFAQGGRKEFFFKLGKLSISRHYLLALLQCESGAIPGPVPHCLSDTAYANLCGSGARQKHRPRKSRLLVELSGFQEDDWLDSSSIIFQPKKCRRRGATSAKARVRRTRRAAVAEQQVAEGSEQASSGSQSSSSSSSGGGHSSHSGSNDGSAGSDSGEDSRNAGHAEVAASSGNRAGRLLPAPPAPPAPSEVASAAASTATAASQRRRQAAVPHTRNMQVATLFGTMGRLTPAREGHQMTCLAHSNCQKTRSSTAQGLAPDVNLRMLKAWLIFGKGLASKELHFSLWADTIVPMVSAGTLPGEEWVESHQPCDTELVELPPPPPPAGGQRGRARPSRPSATRAGGRPASSGG